MKHLKKIMALVIACVMILGTMSMASFGATTSFDPKIEITGLEDVKSVDFYQVLKWEGADGAYAGWSLTEPFETFANNFTATADESAEKIAVRTLIGDPGGNPAVEMKLSADLAGKLAKLTANGAANSVKHAGTLSSDKKTASYTITKTDTDANLGLYMALITPEDQKMVYNPVFVSADYNTKNPSASWSVTTDSTYYGKGAAKKSTVEIDKQAEVSNGTSYDSTWLSTRIGETVEYSVKTTIPGYGPVYTNPVFKVHDKLTGLKLTGEPVLVKPEGLRKGTDYTVTGGAGSTDYTIDFKASYLTGVSAPTEVEITYEAEVTEDADAHLNTEKNEVWVEFSHNPSDENDKAYDKDDTNHYTFDIDADAGANGEGLIGKSGSEIVKVGVDAAGNPVTSEKLWSKIDKNGSWESPLAGAKFKLYTDKDCKTEYTKVNGSKYDNLESDGDGRIKITGLDAGEYWLKETDAPNGYIAQQEAVHIEIIPEYEEQEVTQYTNGTNWVTGDSDDYDPAVYKDKATYKVQVLKKVTIKVDGKVGATHYFVHDSGSTVTWESAEAVELPSSIVNTKGVELPSTGGIGTTVFYIIGAILIVGAGVILVTRRRMEAE